MARYIQERGLTEYNLALHNEALQKRDSRSATTVWTEKVITDEQIHQFYSQFRINGIEQGVDIEDDMERISQSISVMDYDSIPGHTSASLKLFEQRFGQCMESPLERFLTPDGCSDPCYFARPALTRMDTPFGSMIKKDEREEIARMNAELASSSKDY